MPQPFSLLVKPASADCNLRCDYCFYLGHSEFYPEHRTHRMPEPVLESMVRGYLGTAQPNYRFGWQGGEPTLMGLEFFRRVVELQAEWAAPGSVVENGVQTNGTLLTPELAAHFGRYRFLCGVSLDGPGPLHDRYRCRVDGSGSFADVRRGLGLLREHRVEFNILTLVSAANVRHAADVYSYLTDNEYLYHQYIPCVEIDARQRPLPWSIHGEEWGDFLCTLFDLWYPGDTRRVSIRLFDAVLSLLVDDVRTICHFGTNCCQYFVVEYNGDVYPCDFFVERRLRLGNISTEPWSVMQSSPLYRSFGEQKSMLPQACTDCAYRQFCAGDCPKHRLCGGGKPRRLSALCAGWKRFYKHALPRLREIAGVIRDERQRSLTPTQRVGRNDLCPCGSGKKSKKCCGRT